MKLVECVPNISDCRRPDIYNAVAAAAASVSGVTLLNVDPGADTNRTVITFVGEPEAVLEGAFADELALLQPTPGYMRLVNDRILHVWEQRRAEANDRTVAQQRRVSTIQQKMDKLDEAFLYSEAIDVTTYCRQRDKLREEDVRQDRPSYRGRR
jgi:hypothetical protein